MEVLMFGFWVFFVFFLTHPVDGHVKVAAPPFRGNRLRQGQKINGPWTKSCLLPVFVHKVLLECNYVYLFIYCLWLLSHYKSKVEQLQQRLDVLQKPKYLLFALLEKILVDPQSRQQYPIEFSVIMEMFYISALSIRGTTSY